MPNRTIHDNEDPSISDESLEELADLMDDDSARIERDMATEEIFDTQHGDGLTYNPYQAWEQGLVYIPPDDPPVLPSDDRQGSEVAAGFVSMTQGSVDAEVLPDRVDNQDDELQDDVYTMLRQTSETMDLTDITVRVQDGVVTLLGTVPDENDIALVDEVVANMDGVEDVENRLDTEY